MGCANGPLPSFSALEKALVSGRNTGGDTAAALPSRTLSARGSAQGLEAKSPEFKWPHSHGFHMQLYRILTSIGRSLGFLIPNLFSPTEPRLLALGDVSIPLSFNPRIAVILSQVTLQFRVTYSASACHSI